MEIVFPRLHHIDYENDNVESAKIEEDDVLKYIENITKQTIENTKGAK